ncbi:MAG: hypothetical protein QMC85_07765 [Methanocellales archaeon]|nr:hypothetical protein [Methanocellales archaeon]MDI6902811.1 hypothetical protein [Methanocellales archaeon]
MERVLITGISGFVGSHLAEFLLGKNEVIREGFLYLNTLISLGIKMGGIKVCISDDVEKKFREAAMSSFGYKKGSISLAAEKALDEWATRTKEALKIMEPPEDPVESIWGMLSHVDKSGVELQHEVAKIRSRRAMGQ